MVPAVFVPKKSGDLRICINYRELNKQITKDAYPSLLPDEVQDPLAGSTIFSTLDLQSELPYHPAQLPPHCEVYVSQFLPRMIVAPAVVLGLVLDTP